MRKFMLIKGGDLHLLNEDYIKMAINTKVKPDFYSLLDQKIALNYTIMSKKKVKSVSYLRIGPVNVSNLHQFTEIIMDALKYNNLNMSNPSVDKIIISYGSNSSN